MLVIEHNLDVIKTADWLIDMGPDGGTGGGEIVAVGTPETVAKVKWSYTGQALHSILFPAKSPRKVLRGLSRNEAAKSIGLITHIEVQGASQHNLKGVDAKIPA